MKTTVLMKHALGGAVNARRDSVGFREQAEAFREAGELPGDERYRRAQMKLADSIEAVAFQFETLALAWEDVAVELKRLGEEDRGEET